MIKLTDYTAMVAELAGRVNKMSTADEKKIDSTVMAVHEEQLVKKLKDKSGVILAVNMPGCEETKEQYTSGDSDALMFIIEKTPAGSQSNEQEVDAYARLQTLMLRLCSLLLGFEDDSFICGSDIKVPNSLKIEWEYNIYGGFNGLSVSFKIKDTNEL